MEEFLCPSGKKTGHSVVVPIPPQSNREPPEYHEELVALRSKGLKIYKEAREKRRKNK